MPRTLSSVLVLALLATALGASAAAAFYQKKGDVVNLTPENFEEKVIKSEEVWLVEFYAPWCGHCKRLTPEWIKAAKELKGKVNIAAVDADKFRDLGGKYNVQGFPTIKIFGADKAKPRDYEGGRSAADIVNVANRELKRLEKFRETGKDEPSEEERTPPPPSSGFYEGTDVVELTDETFEQEVLNGKDAWLIEFYAPWCGHCRSLKPEWIKAAAELAGEFKIGAVDATAHSKFSNKYNVQGFPTIKFFTPGGESTEDYNGGRTSEAIVQYCQQKAELYPSKPLVVAQVADQPALEALCKDKLMCVIFIVQHVIDVGAAGRNAQLELFAAIAKKFRSRRVAVGWIQGGDHPAFEEGFGIYTTYPTFAAINIKNKRATTHKGAFTESSITESINRILSGRKAGLTQLKDVPRLSAGVELWDGKDYVAPEDD